MKQAKGNKRKEPTSFAAESEAADPQAQETAAASTGPSKAMLALFNAPTGLDLSRAKRVNMPSLIKPGDIPIFTQENQAILVFKIVKGVKSFKASIKGICIWIKLPTGDERLLPCTGAIRQALVPGVDADNAASLIKAVDGIAGSCYALKRLPNTVNKQYNKEQFIFDIFELDSKTIP